MTFIFVLTKVVLSDMSTYLSKHAANWRDALLNLPIWSKMTGAFAIVIIMIFVSAGSVFWNIYEGLDHIKENQEVDEPLLQLVNDLRYYSVALSDNLRAYILDPQDSEAYERYFRYLDRFNEAFVQAQVYDNQPEDAEIFAVIDDLNAELSMIERELLANPSLELFQQYDDRYRELRLALSSQFDRFFADYQLHVIEEREDIVAHFTQSLIIIVVAVTLLFVVSTLVAQLVIRYIVSSLHAMIEVSHEFAKGNLGARIHLTAKDELGMLADALNHAAENEQRYIKDLEAARRQAEDATRMKDLFLATMSHELRTPLNAMIGFLHLMIYSDQLDEDNTYMAERSLANTQRLLTLINNILDLSRIATGGLQIVPSPLQIRYMIAGLYNDLKMLAHDKGLRLALDVDPTLPETINHDETRLSQIITNLVGNAIKFTERGEVTLQIQRQADELIIRVSDTGIGIPKAKLGLIFDDFFQVDASSTRQQQGAGLGLAIVKRLVILMGGKINVESKVGVGSTFTVELPLELPAFSGQTKPDQEHAVFASSIDQARLMPSLN